MIPGEAPDLSLSITNLEPLCKKTMEDLRV